MGAVLPLTDEEDHLVLAHPYGGLGDDHHDVEIELNSGAPHYPYGVIFLRRIFFKRSPDARYIPRMVRGGRFLSQNAVLHLFGESEEDMRQRYFGMAGFLQG
jgi:hypothetical protein